MPSLFEHQIHQNITYTSNRRHSMHINKNSSIGLTVWCRNNRRCSACTTNICEGHQCWLCCVPTDISLLYKIKVVRPII